MVPTIASPSFGHSAFSINNNSNNTMESDCINVCFRFTSTTAGKVCHCKMKDYKISAILSPYFSHNRFLEKNIFLEVNPEASIKDTKKKLLLKMIASEATLSTTKEYNNFIFTLLFFLWRAITLHLTRPEDFYFIHKGKPLDDGARWTDYHIFGNNCTVSVQPRLRGGCFMVSASVLVIICTALVGSTCTCGMSLIVIPFLLPLLFVLPLFCL